MWNYLRGSWLVIKEAATEAFDHDVLSHAAGIAFYTAFGLAPTILLFLAVNEIGDLVGEEAAAGVKIVIENAESEDPKKTASTFSTIVSIATFLFSASGVFAQLQLALNTIWNVMPRPGAGVWDWLRKRLISMGMVVGMMVLMLASLVASTAIAIVIPGDEAIWRFLNIAISIAVFTVLFGLIFKFLPDVKITWRDVFAGSLMTAILFSLGKWAIGLYLGHSAIGSAYGVAGSLIVTMVWVYYSAIILLFGAEITQVYARHFGSGIHPDRHAVRVERPKPIESPPEPKRGKRK
jgi:membrane protein